MGGLNRAMFLTTLLRVLCIPAAAVAVVWFLALALRSFYPVEGGNPRPRVDAGLLTQGALAVLCLAVVAVFLAAAWNAGWGGARRPWRVVGVLALAAVLVTLALTTERFIHAGPSYLDSPPVYSGEAGLWATYFWVMAGGVLATAILVLVQRTLRRWHNPRWVTDAVAEQAHQPDKPRPGG